MAYVVAGKGRTWEVRESRTTKAGPRSRTLATFSVLTPEVVERASQRAAKPLDRGALERSALRVGAPVAEPVPDRAARDLLEQLTAGRRPRRVLGHLLREALAGDPGAVSDAARSAAGWAGATPERRAGALVDLLLLADALPPARGPRAQRFPRIESSPA